MIQNNNFSVLPFYNSPERQYHKKSYTFGTFYPLYADADMLIPFQFLRKHYQVAGAFDSFNFNSLDLFPNITPGSVFDDKIFFSHNTTLRTEAPPASSSGTVENAVIYLETDGTYALKIYEGGRLIITAPNGCYIDSIDFDGSSAGLEPEIGALSDGVFKPDEQINAAVFDVIAAVSIDKVTVVYTGVAPVNAAYIRDENGVTVESFALNKLIARGLHVVPEVATIDGEVYDMVVYTAKSVDQHAVTVGGALLDKPGRYYLQINDGNPKYRAYSEVMTLVNDLDMHNLVKITWSDYDDFIFDAGALIYSSGFEHKLYLDTDIGHPDYKFSEEGKDRDGYFFAEKQISEKVYKFVFVAPEYLCDAMRFIRLSDKVTIEKDGDTYKCDSFLMEPKWEEQGNLASVEVEFKTNTAAKKIAAGWPE